MEATLSALSIGALIYGIMKSRQLQDKNDISTVIPPSFGQALTVYQQNPNNDNLKKLEQLKIQEQNELERVKRQVQEEANRKIAQILSDAKAQAQKMYAQGKLEEAKNIEKMAALKRTALQEDTQSNLEELGKRFQNTMDTVNIMITDAKLITDKDLQKQIAAVTNELRTSRNNEALLRQQVAQLQALLKNQPSNAVSQRQIQELKYALDNAKKCAYESDMLKRELVILKSAKNGDQNAMKISNQFLELKRQLDEAKQNEQRLLFQLEKERMMKNSGTNVASKFKIQELENELNRLRRAPSGNAGKDTFIANLKFELENAKQREREAVEQLMRIRNTTDDVRQLQNETQFAKQRAYELEHELERLSSNANQKVSQMADEIATLKYHLQKAKDEYIRLRDNANVSDSDEQLYYAKQQVRELQKKLQALSIAGNARSDDFKYALRIAELENELQNERLSKNPSNTSVATLEKELTQLRSKSSEQAQELSNVITKYTHELEQAKAKEINARKELLNAKIATQNNEQLKIELLEAQNKIKELQNTLSNKSRNANADQRTSAMIDNLQKQLKEAKNTEIQLREQLKRPEQSNSVNASFELSSAKNEIQRLKNELAILKDVANMPKQSVQDAETIAKLTLELKQLRNAQPSLVNALSNAKMAREEVERLNQKCQEVESYRKQIEDLKRELLNKSRETSPPANNVLASEANKILLNAQQKRDEIMAKAEKEANDMKAKARENVLQSNVNARVLTLKRELQQANENAQKTVETAATKSREMTNRINDLEQKVIELEDYKKAIENQLPKINPNTALTAQKQINVTMSNALKQIKQTQGIDSNLKECLDKLDEALKSAQVNLKDTENIVLNERGTSPLIQDELQKYKDILLAKEKALSEANLMLSKYEAIKGLETGNNVGAVENKLKNQVNSIVEQAKQDVSKMLEANKCSRSTCPEWDMACDKLPCGRMNFTTDVYRYFYEKLKYNINTYYNTKKDNPLDVYNVQITKKLTESSIPNIPVWDKMNDNRIDIRFVPLIDLDWSNSASINSNSSNGNNTETSTSIASMIFNNQAHIHKTLQELYNYIKPSNPGHVKTYTEKETKTVNTISIIKLYINALQIVLQSPATYIFTALPISALKRLLDSNQDTNIQLYDVSKTDSPLTIDREFFIIIMCKFLYIDITGLLEVREDKSNISTFYVKYFFKLYRDGIIDTDSRNCNTLLIREESCKNKYLYIEKFWETVKSSLEKHDIAPDAPTQIFYDRLLLYIATSLPFFVTFVKYIYKNLEDQKNKQLLTDFKLILAKHAKSNVLTYIKVRNEAGKKYNARYNVFVGGTSTDNKSEENTALLVQYNEHNFPYYQKTENSTTTQDTFKVDMEQLRNFYDKIYSFPKFENVFSNAQNAFVVDNYKDEYLLGPFTKVFNQNLANSEIASSMEDVLNHLKNENPRPVFIIGYGASGAGKTSTLIYFNKGEKNDKIDTKTGVLMHLCKLMAKAGFNMLHIKCYEYYNAISEFKDNEKPKFDVTTRILPSQKSNTNPYLKFKYDQNKDDFVLTDTYNHKNHFYSRTKSETVQFTTKSTLGEVLIHMIDNDRFVKATTNNPNSSRSHALVVIRFGQNDRFENNRILFIGDFAGVENEFNCDSNQQLLGFMNTMEDKIDPQPFYSTIDPSMYGEEGKIKNVVKGGMRNRYAKQPKQPKQRIQSFVGGAFSRVCEFVKDDKTQEFFTLYQSERVKNKTSNKSINTLSQQIFKNNIKTNTGKAISASLDVLLENPVKYGAFLDTIYTNILQANGIEHFKDQDPLKTLLHTPRNDVLSYFQKYMDTTKPLGISKFVKDTIKFIEIFKGIQVNSAENPSVYLRDAVFKSVLIGDMTVYDFMNISENGIDITSAKDSIENFNDLKLPTGAVRKLTTVDNKTLDIMTYSSMSGIKAAGADKRMYLAFGVTSNDIKNTSFYSARGKVESLRENCLKTMKSTTDKTYYSSNYSGLAKTPFILYKFKKRNNSGIAEYESTRLYVDELFKKMSSFLDEPFFKYLEVSIPHEQFTGKNVQLFYFDDIASKMYKKNIANVNHNNLIDNVQNRFIEPYDNGVFTVAEFCETVVKEAFEVLMEIMCRKDYYKHICTVRKNEGYFINRSLMEIREIIKLIMFEKNKDSINVAPLFYEECLPAYCEKAGCFKSSSSTTLSNIIFETVANELSTSNRNITSVLKDLVISVFVVINLSRNANNPPPVPYIDTNGVRIALGKKRLGKEIQFECQLLKNRLDALLAGTVNPQISASVYNFIDEFSKTVINKTGKTSLGFQLLEDFNEKLTYLENISAASLIGTLHYADALAKYNSTKAICSQRVISKRINRQQDNGQINVYENLLKKLNFHHIVTTDITLTRNNQQEEVKEQVKELDEESKNKLLKD